MRRMMQWKKIYGVVEIKRIHAVYFPIEIPVNNHKFYLNLQILTGNINTYSEVENALQPIIVASKVRIYPYSQYDRTVCLRVELVGCPWIGKFKCRKHSFTAFNFPIRESSNKLFDQTGETKKLTQSI